MYELLHAPFALDFEEMSRRQLAQYESWFFATKPNRVAALEELVQGVVPSWRADGFAESLTLLDSFLDDAIETRPRSAEELSRLVKAFRFGVSDRDLTDRSISIAVDSGFYFGQVFEQNHSELSWKQEKRKGNVDYGQLVLCGFPSKVCLNPVRIAIVNAYAIAKGKSSRLAALYLSWLEG